MPAYSMGLIYWWARMASRMPNLVNFFTQTPPFSTVAKALGGIAQERHMPKFATETFKAWFFKREALRGAHAPSRAVPGALAGNTPPPTGTAADFGESDAPGESSARTPQTARGARGAPQSHPVGRHF